MALVRGEAPSGLANDFVFSQSSLQAYADCPRGFQLRYIDHVIWPATRAEPAAETDAHRRDGRLFHALIQQHRLGLPLDQLSALAHGPNVARWWQNYLEAELGLSGYTQRAEYQLSAPITGHRIVAKYDLLATNDGAAVVYDWKTSATRPGDKSLADRLETRVYLALVLRAGVYLNSGLPIRPETVTMIYWFADFPSQPSVLQYGSDAYQRDWSALEELTQRISRATQFAPCNDERRCVSCSYHSYCE